jgi:hypothetical protein
VALAFNLLADLKAVLVKKTEKAVVDEQHVEVGLETRPYTADIVFPGIPPTVENMFQDVANSFYNAFSHLAPAQQWPEYSRQELATSPQSLISTASW